MGKAPMSVADANTKARGMCSMKSMQFSALCAAVVATAFAFNAVADVYILGGESNESNVGSSSTPVSWSDTSNWTPAQVPGASDTVNWAPSKTGSHRHAYVALDGDYGIGALDTNYRTIHLYRSGSSPVTFTVNTQLGGDGYQQSHEVTDGVKLVVASGASFVCSKGDHALTGIDVKTGGEADIYGSLQSRVMKLDVNGGTLLLAPTSYVVASWGRSGDDHDEINVNSGAASFPNGIAMTGTSSTPNNQFNQAGGTVTFGGDFTSAMNWDYTWSGGALNVTGDCAFGANIALVVPASASVALDVAAGKTFSAPGLSV
ncbi:MAG: hypothetical protein IKE55_03110, partial [Kiritimatiellae bacterium]|nr:hypothetical protein [Kiritimatiellia bacterium]